MKLLLIEPMNLLILSNYTYLYIISVFEIFIHIAIPIINKTDTNIIIASNTLKDPPISPSRETIFLSARGSQTACARLYVIVKATSFITGMMHIPRIITIPIIPTEFFKTEAAPNTISAESLKVLPTTGIRLEAALLIPFAVIPSMLLVRLPSNDKILTKTVTTIPKTHITPDFKNLDNFSI